MASTKRPQGTSRPGGASRGPGQSASTGGGPRRLGGQQPPPRRQGGAQRRYERARQKSTFGKRFGWIAVGVVLAVVIALVVVKLTSGGSSANSGTSAADRNPVAAPAAEVNALTTIPASVFNTVGVAGQPAAFAVTANQPRLTLGGKPRFVYEGAEYCPYCAVTRYSIVAALSRFGTFSGLKKTSSGPNDLNIPTFSFLGSHYTSKYVAFTPYEAADRLQKPLQKVPADVNSLYLKYDGDPTTGQPSKFASGMWQSPGIPFLDIANKYVVAGSSPGLYGVVSSGVLQNGGPGRLAIANAIHSPDSPTGKAIQASQFIVEANYLAAAICDVDGHAPASLCASPGVTAAAKTLATVKPVG